MNNIPIGISRTVSAVAILPLLCRDAACSEHFTVCHITKYFITFTDVWEETASLPQGKAEGEQQQPEVGYVLSAVQ